MRGTWVPTALVCAVLPPALGQTVQPRRPHPLQAVLLLCMSCRDADVAKDAEAHGAAGKGVVTWRTTDGKPGGRAATGAACLRPLLPAGGHNVVYQRNHRPCSLQQTRAGVVHLVSCPSVQPACGWHRLPACTAGQPEAGGVRSHALTCAHMQAYLTRDASRDVVPVKYVGADSTMRVSPQSALMADSRSRVATYLSRGRKGQDALGRELAEMHGTKGGRLPRPAPHVQGAADQGGQRLPEAPQAQ